MNYHNITHDDMNNGDGLRVVLWLSGCSHMCKSCQNPLTWNPDSGILFDNAAKNEILEQLNKDYISGITFSGGDPLHENNIKNVMDLIVLIRTLYFDKTIWLYTGYKYEEFNDSMLAIFSLCDVVIDCEYEEDKRDIDLKWRGSSNQRVIDCQETLKQGKIVLYCD